MQRIWPHAEGLPELNKPHKEDHPGPKKFEDYSYTYSRPDVQPQMQIDPVVPGLTNNYDQALGVIKDSINTANQLASLKLQSVTTIAPSCGPVKF